MSCTYFARRRQPVLSSTRVELLVLRRTILRSITIFNSILIFFKQLWIPCPRTNTPRENFETLSAFQTSFLEAVLGELGRLSCLETRHGAFSSTFRRRIRRGGYIARQILRMGTLEGPAAWSFDPSAEGAMTTARPPLSLIICPCLSLLSTDYCLSPCCHTLGRCSLTVRTLCLRRDEWDHDPPTVTTRISFNSH